MKKLLLTTAFIMLAAPAFAKDYTIKEVSDPAGDKPYYFSPDKLTIQPGDTVNFVNAQEDMHDVMFINVPKGVDEMIMSPMHEKEGDKFSYTFTVPGTYQFHCHPHEELGMKGTLIVGTASKPGETVAMDHHKMGKMHDMAMMGKKEGHSDCMDMMGKDHKMSGECPMMKEQAKAEEHSEHHGDATAPSGLSMGTGKINSVDVANHTINITHDPIKALGWPKMKMEFPVEPNVDLGGVKAGDTVKFGLKSIGEDDYIITTVDKQ